MFLHHSVTAYAAAILLSFHSWASAQLDKPLINPPMPFDKIDQGLLDHLEPTFSTSDAWGGGWIPKDCKDIVEGNTLKATDVEVFNVHYSDCSEPWIMCHHKDSPVSKIDMIDLFGRMPVRMRSFVRHLVAMPGGQSAGSNGDNIQLFGTANVISIFVHETGHGLDSHAFPPDVTPFD
ncbi:hypothetical protein GP486_008232, partial [Trichoglossum hirsutum]